MRYLKQFGGILLGIGALSHPAISAAESNLGVQNHINGAANALVEKYRSSISDDRIGLLALQPISFSISIESLGSVEVTFSKFRNKTWKSYFDSDVGSTEDHSTLLLLQGELRQNGEKDAKPVAGAIYDEDGIPTLHLTFQGSGTGELRSVEVNIPLDGSSASAVASSPSELGERLCGTEGESVAHSTSSNRLENGALTVKVADLSTDADYDFFLQQGANSNSRISAIVNAADAIYQGDLGVRLQIAEQHVWSSSSGNPMTSTNSSTLLSQFRTYTNTNHQIANADVYHLFSGKDFDSSIVGLAYLGVVCFDSGYTFGTTQHVSTALDYLIFAHEVGHNFGADHDAGPGFVMSPYVNDSGNHFSTSSISEIQSHLASYNSCLADGPDTRPEAPSLTLTSSFDSRAGVIRSTIGITDVSGQSCDTILEMSNKSNFSSGVSRKKVYTGTPTSVSAQSTAAKKVRAGKSDSSDVYIRAAYSCGGTVQARSASKRMRIPKTSAKSAPKLSDWIKKASRLFAKVS